MNNKKYNDGDVYLRSRSISEPDITFDKSGVYSNRFKTKHFPFEYIAVDDLHYYRRRQPCNCKRNLFQSNLSLHSNNRTETRPNFNGRTEYTRAFTEKPNIGKLPALKRPPNLKVDAYPFLTGLYKSDTSLNYSGNYKTEYDTNFFDRPYSPRIGPIRRATNIKLNPGVMDNRSEQKSQFRAYNDDAFTKARPAMIKKPNNLHLTGNIELFPEYRSKYIPYSIDSVYKSNKTPCFHPKPREKRVRKVQEVENNSHIEKNRDIEVQKRREEEERMADLRRIKEAKAFNNNYNTNNKNRYHEKHDYECSDYVPEYRSKYKPVIGEKSALIPQQCHFQKNDDEFNSVSEYNNRYKGYDQFTKSAPIKKQDNLYMRGETQMQPEYQSKYKPIDYKNYTRQGSIRQQDNLHADPKIKYNNVVPEYSDKYKSYNVMPERATAKEDYLHLNGDMEYEAEYRNNYVEFPRQRPIIKKPSTHIQLSSGDRHERKPDNFNLPINLQYHDPDSAKFVARDDDDEIPFEQTPEYRTAMKNLMLKQRSPTREIEKKVIDEKKPITKIIVDHNDVTKILTENKVNVPEEKIFDENNEVIVEKLKGPSNFKIPTRSPTSLSLQRPPSYPIQQDEKFSEHLSVSRKPRKTADVVSFHIGENQKSHSTDFDDYCDEDENNNNHIRPPVCYQNERADSYERPKKSPKFGRRAPNPREDYNVRKKTNVIEGNSKFSRNYQPNRHEQRAFHVQPNSLQFAQKPSDSLANNYRPNYEIDKQQSYRESLNNNEPFVVLDREIANKVKQSSWMKKQWYDTN